MTILSAAVAILLAHAVELTRAAPQSSSKHVTIPLTQKQSENADLSALTLHAVSRHVSSKPGFAIAPETLSGGFWYANFDVGESKSLSLLIDTGSDDVALDPGLYKPSSKSKNLQEKGQLEYATAQANGCGFADIHYETYADTVSLAGLTAKNQTFGNVQKSTPPNAQTISVFPHQGIVGMGGTLAAETQLGGTPFFQNLCNQGVVNECRFGLAFGTSGKGVQVLGGVDKSLFEGHLATAPSQKGDPVTFTGDVIWQGKDGSEKSLKDQSILFDSGTSNVVASYKEVLTLFEHLGIQAVNQTSKACKGVTYGYYKCDSPVKVGITIGGKPFYIEPSAFKFADNGNNNCTATVTAVSESFPFWIFGQSFMQGKYIDFQQPKTIGVATLKDKTGSSW